MKIAAWFIGAFIAALTLFMLFTAGWERPPIDSEQTGYRGTGMADIINPRTEAALESSQVAPQAATPLPPAAGPRAGDIYQNVQVLGDLSVARFTRLMQAITEWVSPDQGCVYCHNLENLAEDSVYTKVVARRMLQMTQEINGQWGDHVQETGVTCYTCHRGQNVPQYGWFNADPDAAPVGGLAGWRNGQNRASPEVGLTSLPEDPFTRYIDGNDNIRVIGDKALPNSASTASIQMTEGTYALMIHMSEALGVNCTYCHNSRGFAVWNESTPQRATSWYGLEMARALNTEYVSPLSDVLPSDRLGATGEGLKINCTTCHQGVNKPLYGASMVGDYPSLRASSAAGESMASDSGDDDSSSGAIQVAAGNTAPESAAPMQDVMPE
ncbi:MAG: photosynthetic reaction center cytochrome PufC [Wenzhouxiangellaceae bacterium]